MNPYVINLLLLVFWATLIRPEKTTKRKEVYCVMCSIQMGLLAGFRADSVWKDGYMYHGFYNSLQYGSMSEDISNLVRYLMGGEYVHTDPGFFVYMRFLRNIGCSWNHVVIVTSIITSLAFAYFVISESENPLISYLVYVTLFFPFVSMMAMRQGLAISVSVLIGFPLARKSRLREFLLAVAVGFLMHKSAVLALPIYWLAKLRYNDRLPFAVITCGVILVPLSSRLIAYFNSLLNFGGDYTTAYVGTRTLVYVVGISAVWVLGLVARDGVPEDQESQYDSLLWLLSVGLLLCTAAFTNSNVLRVAYYYIIPIVALIPISVKSLEAHLSILVRLAIPIVCLLFVILIQPRVLGSTQYLPYWY